MRPQYMMVQASFGQHLAFAGTTEPAAMCTISIINDALNNEKNGAICKAITEILAEKLG